MATTLATRPDALAVLIIDVQPYFLDGWMAGASEPLLARLEYLLGLATVYDLPCLATFEEPVAEKGWLPARLEPFFPPRGERHRKDTFNCCAEPDIVAALARVDRPRIAVAGAETDVCVLQSVLGLLEAGREVLLLEDALFSSEPNVGPALRRMEAAGAIPATVKTLAYELRRAVSSPRPDDALRARSPALRLPRPEALPPWRDPIG
ncbi:MAG TPA: isochorismatase family protein [Thermomicrobiales bacterium]|nr:isochorismatase family protein [Thermomicrobiales bacterium]